MKLEKAARYAESKTGVQLWADYLRMARELGYDLTEATVAMPKDLRERHDAAAELLEIRKDQAATAAYAKRYKQLCRKYEFALSGLRIVVPKSGSEIVREGKTLHHCVGGYAARHMSGKTTILFLRHEKRPERPWMTIELTGKDTIRQIHGYKNEGYNHAQDPEERYAWFLDAWLGWVHAGSRRDKQKQPILEAKEKTA
ncbi:MAG: PcfJ domain-containing protein [Oscillospiraceae bacterium]